MAEYVSENSDLDPVKTQEVIVFWNNGERFVAQNICLVSLGIAHKIIGHLLHELLVVFDKSSSFSYKIDELAVILNVSDLKFEQIRNTEELSIMSEFKLSEIDIFDVSFNHLPMKCSPFWKSYSSLHQSSL